MALNPNTGPERVEVTPVPTGTVLVPGAPTAITAFIIQSNASGAPVDAPTSTLSLDDVVAQFGDEDDMGEAFFAIRGFFANAGVGNQAIIVNISPTASGTSVFDRGVAEVGAGGLIEDEGEILTSLSISSYVSATGILTLGGSPDLSEVQVGDFFKDDNGRLFLISAVDDGADTLTIPSGLFTVAGEDVHSSNGLNVGSTAGKILRLFDEDEHNGRALIQEGSSKGAVTIDSSVNRIVGASAGGFLNIGTKVGDILVDSGSAVFYITAVIDDDQIEVDRAGAAAGAATVNTGEVEIIQDTQRSAGSNDSVAPQNVAAFESSGAGFGILPTSAGPYPADSLNNHFANIAGEEKEIASQIIVASSTLNAAFGTSSNTLTYTASTGVVQFAGAEDLSTTNPGDVWRDASNNDFVINAVDDGGDNITIAPNQTVNTAVGSTIRDGQVRINFSDASFNPGTADVPEFQEPANQLDIPASATGAADDYFVADAIAQDSDYIGTQANGKGLHALDNVDDVNLITIPTITSRVAQNALIDYCETERQDCFALLTIPENIRKPATDTILVNVTISTITNGDPNSTVTMSGSPNLSAVSEGDLLEFNGTKYLIVDVDDEDDKITVESTSITGSGAAVISAPSAISYKETIINNPSERAAWYFNHIKVLRSEDSSIVTVDPVGHVAGIMARIDGIISLGGVSRAPAGIGVADLADTVGLDLAISEKSEAGPLRLNFINRITEFPGAGRIVFGAYTADSGTSPAFTAQEQLIQIQRSILFVKSSLEPGLRSFIWDNFSPLTQAQVEQAILTFLRNNSYLFPAGLPENEQFRVIRVEPTQADKDLGLMKFRVQVNFNTPVRFIDIDLEFPIPQAA